MHVLVFLLNFWETYLVILVFSLNMFLVDVMKKQKDRFCGVLCPVGPFKDVQFHLK